MEFVTVFDLGVAGYRGWWFPLIGLFPAAAGALMAFAPALTKKLMGSHVRGRLVRVLGALFLGVGLLAAVMGFADTYGDYRSLRRALDSGQYRTVEGAVRNFRPMPAAGWGWETFEVEGVTFRLTTSALNPAFNRTRAEGGPVAEGVHVRIAYVNLDILRLEMRK